MADNKATRGMTSSADEKLEFCERLRIAANRAFALSEDRTGERHRLLQASYRLDERANAWDAETRCEDNRKRANERKRDMDRQHDKWMKANGWFLPRKAVVYWDSRALPKSKRPKLARRMASAGKRYSVVLDKLHREMDWQRMTIRADGNETRDYDKAEENERTRPLLLKAREEFKKCATTCGLTIKEASDA